MSDYLFIYILKSLYSKCESNDEGIYSMLAIQVEEYILWLECSQDVFSKHYNKYLQVLNTCYSLLHFHRDMGYIKDYINDSIAIFYIGMEDD